MSRALVTWATGPHIEMLEIALPSLEEFADRHGYELLTPDVSTVRPPSWAKVPILRAALDEYDEALWVDADVVITDPSDDMPVPAWAWQAIVRHRTDCGEVPNCGVWFVRRQMRAFLDVMWSKIEHLHHGWWEQAAMLDLLGYQHEPRPARLNSPTKLYERTFWLDNGWNQHPHDEPQPERARFRHATQYYDRPAVMREWAAGVIPLAVTV